MASRCILCKMDFTKYCNLRTHVKRLHPDKLDEIAPVKLLGASAVCNGCNKTFTKYSNLVSHVKKFHPDQVDDLIKPKTYNHTCGQCNKHFSHLRNFRNHQKTHGNGINAKMMCTLCKDLFVSKFELYDHFRNKHDILVTFENLKFKNLEEFSQWKSKIEKDTTSAFINKHGSYITTNYTKVTYTCHRSGSYVAKGKGIRHLKMQGSNKMNGICPAKISVKVFGDGTHEIVFTKTHVGHTTDLGHLNISKSEREMLASKIAAKIPFGAILDEVRDSICDNKLERTHLLTKKDLYNIEQCFNLNSESVRHTKDAVSIEAWVKQMESSGCVLYYKPQNVPCERYPQLRKEDFVLIIMNEGQKEMMLRYGHDCICIDGTHGLNAYDFELNTVIVLDDLREGFPCGFLISNRSDEKIMTIFFSSIKEKIGYALKPLVFMSDMAQTFYNAWLCVMHPATFRLYCTWHIDRAWRRNLCKIDTKEKQVTVYKQLRTLLQERDVCAFTQMVNNFVQILLSDPATTEFGVYFSEYYLKNNQAWAYCYRLNSGLNTNMHIERMHRTIKYLYLNGKVVKRLDKAVNALMKFVRDKLFDRLIVLNKGKLCSKVKDIRSRHQTSETLHIDSVVWNGMVWDVMSSSTQEIYKVERRLTDCNCKLVCTVCETCIHQYSCTCIDSCIKWNMCKHIHLVCRLLKNSKTEIESISAHQSQDDNTLIIDESPAVSKHEESRFVEVLCTNKQSSSLFREKANLKNELCQIIDQISSSEEMDALKRLLAPVRPTLSAVKNFEGTHLENRVVSSLPHNKNINQQCVLYKTKKVTVRKDEKLLLSIPDAQESNDIAISLLHN